MTQLRRYRFESLLEVEVPDQYVDEPATPLTAHICDALDEASSYFHKTYDYQLRFVMPTVLKPIDQ